MPDTGDRSAVCRLEDAPELSVDRFAQHERIKPVPQPAKLEERTVIDPGRRPQAIKRSLRGVVTSGAPSAHAGLALQLDRGLEEVVHEPPLVAVPVIDGAECFGRFVSIPAQHLAHLRPVLLLDVGIVVLLIGPPRVNAMSRATQYSQTRWVINSEPLSESRLRKTKGSPVWLSWRARVMPRWPLPGRRVSRLSRCGDLSS